MKPILLAIAAVSLAACAADEAPPSYAKGLGTPESPVPGDAAYAVTSRMAMPLEISEVSDAIADLRAFSEHGGRALLAQTAGTPARAALDALPASLHDHLEGWLDAELDKLPVGTGTVREAGGEIATIAETVMSDFAVESSLTITPSGATHTLRDMNFTPANLDIIIPIGGFDADKLAQRTSSTVAAGGALALGDQQFGLAFGGHAWQAINLASKTLYGDDLSLLLHIDCDAVARNVAAKCASGSCVGHTSDLVAVCQQGMTALVEDLRAAIAPVELDTLRFASGNARLVDDDGDGVADRIVDGKWDAQTDVGLGVRESSVAFTAKD